MVGKTGSGRRVYKASAEDYKLLEEVGYGANAVVYRAIYLPSNDVVAVKCLDLDRCNSNLVSPPTSPPNPKKWNSCSLYTVCRFG
jgi:serine/threonine protein kinase